VSITAKLAKLAKFDCNVLKSQPEHVSLVGAGYNAAPHSTDLLDFRSQLTAQFTFLISRSSLFLHIPFTAIVSETKLLSFKSYTLITT
jgi:hypothetical protein